MPRRIRVIAPPQRALAARLVEPSRPARDREPDVQRQLPRRDMRIRPVPHHPVRLVLVEAQIQIAPDEVPRLRTAPAQRPLHLARQRIVRALLVLQERVQIARRRESDAQHQRVLRGEAQFVSERRVETALRADLRGVGHARKRRAAAIGKRPLRRRHRHRRARLRHPLRQARL